MKKVLLVSIVSLGLLSIGFMSGSVVYNGVDPSKEKIDSLTKVINEKDSLIGELDFQVDVLEEGISEREAEISYWGRKCDTLCTKLLRTHIKSVSKQ